MFAEAAPRGVCRTQRCVPHPEVYSETDKHQIFTCLAHHLFTQLQLHQDMTMLWKVILLFIIRAVEGDLTTSELIMDLRQTGEQRCGHKSFTETTYGSGNFAHCYNTFLPGNPMGDLIFKISMKVSAECSTLLPVGYNVQRTRTSTVGIQSDSGETVDEMSKHAQNAMGFHVGGSFDGFGGSSRWEQTGEPQR